jgi:hypothetical protein
MNTSNGDVYRCTAPEDCPRSARVSLCISDTDLQEECLRCLDTRCVVMTTPSESC